MRPAERSSLAGTKCFAIRWKWHIDTLQGLADDRRMAQKKIESRAAALL
jgi:hypothetical protein